MPMTTEIHPPHTIVREKTIGKVNRITVGMGFPGGFPGSIKAETEDELKGRWNVEFGGHLEDLDRRNRRCWPTNLKKHPLRIKLFPPEKRPTPTAQLRAVLLDWLLIKIRPNSINDFLGRCKGGAGLTDPSNKTFKEWSPGELEVKPAAQRPQLVPKGNYVELTIDLSGVEQIPVGYLASLECGWA